MQSFSRFSLDTSTTLPETRISELLFSLIPWDRIFLSGDLWSGKSTLIRALLRRHFSDEDMVVRSPTYTYYQKYGSNIYHFDLYRIESYDDLLLLWAIEIFDNPNSICIIEWPDILGDTLYPTKSISISIEDPTTRIYTLTTYKPIWASTP